MSRIKKFLGIEGVKVNFDETTQIDLKAGEVSGKLLIKSKVPSLIKSIHIQVIEKYQRGNKNNQRISEYILFSKIILPKSLSVDREKVLEIPFVYPIYRHKSEMDLLEESNFLLKPLVGIAKKLYQVKSNYSITATLQIEGSGVKPFANKNLFPVK